MSSTLYDVVVVGAGLCGLSSAVKLRENGLRVLLLEAGTQPGGRVRSVRDLESGEFLGDLGASWVWPARQAVLQAWLDSLGISTFRQYSSGLALIDTDPDAEPFTHILSEQADARRIVDGVSSLVSALLGKLADTSLRCCETVFRIDSRGSHVAVYTRGRPEPFQADKVIVALPPRIALDSIEFLPGLQSSLLEAMRRTPTWMAAQAKAVILYREPFWRERHLSGGVHSQPGPLAELHDHCGPQGYPAALGGFLGWDAARRLREAATLEQSILEQLQRLFGIAAPEPLHIVIKDWARETRVASAADLSAGHPSRPTMPDASRLAQHDARLWFGGAEFSAISPGLIEGAFARADDIVAAILETRSQ